MRQTTYQKMKPYVFVAAAVLMGITATGGLLSLYFDSAAVIMFGVVITGASLGYLAITSERFHAYKHNIPIE